MTKETILEFQRHDFANNVERTRNFLKNQRVLTDYNLDGTVADIMISIMAEANEKLSMTASQLFAESFIYSASLRKNVVAKASDLGYTVRSSIASKAIVDIVVDASRAPNPLSSLSLPKGSMFSGTSDNSSLVFSTTRTYTASLAGNSYTFRDVELYQGGYGTIELEVDKFVSPVLTIPVKDIDTSLMEVYLRKSKDSTEYKRFMESRDSISASPNDAIYFVQEMPSGLYGIQFGDGIIGTEVEDQSKVRIVYFKTDGDKGNGVDTFSFSLAPTGPLMQPEYRITGIRTSFKSAGGSDVEDIESIRRNAPKALRAKSRAVTVDDYGNQLKQRFPYVNAVTVWTGEPSNMEQTGTVYVAVNSYNGQYLTSKQKAEIIDEIKNNFGIAGINVVMKDAESIFVDIRVSIVTDLSVFGRSSDIVKDVEAYVRQYAANNFGSFDSMFEMSRFRTGIDNCNNSIRRNSVSCTMQKRYQPELLKPTTINLFFNQRIKSLHSSSFTYKDASAFSSIFRADSTGDIRLYDIVGNTVNAAGLVGSVDFATGNVNISNAEIALPNAKTNDIRFYASPESDDIKAKSGNVLQLGEVIVEIEK